jgi:hypothetical protein
MTLSMLAEQITSIKQRKERPVETNHPVQYRFTFTDQKDRQLLRPPVVGAVADDIVKDGKAVETIMSVFGGRAGTPPTIHVTTFEGPQQVTSQEEWNEAVHSLWVQFGDGALVDVELCL